MEILRKTFVFWKLIVGFNQIIVFCVEFASTYFKSCFLNLFALFSCVLISFANLLKIIKMKFIYFQSYVKYMSSDIMSIGLKTTIFTLNWSFVHIISRKSSKKSQNVFKDSHRKQWIQLSFTFRVNSLKNFWKALDIFTNQIHR